MSEESRSFYHYMVAAKVIFGPKAGDEPTADELTQVQGIEINAVVLNDTETFPVQMVSRAQQAAHMQFLQRIGEAQNNIQVHDVVILGLIPLGLMSKETFNAKPDPVKAEPDLKAVAKNDFDE